MCKTSSFAFLPFCLIILVSTAVDSMQLGSVAGITALATELGKQPVSH